MKKLIASLTSVALLVSSSKANINDTLDKIVSSAYYEAPGLIKSPTTDTLTLGSYSFRLRTDLINRPVLTLTPPRATFSCSGADFDAGMLSMLNLNTLGDMLQQAGSTVAWGIMIGLLYSIPVVGDAFKALNQWAREYQQLSFNACMVGTQIGKRLGDAIWENFRTDTQGNSVATGRISSFEEAHKEFLSVIETSGDIKKLFGTIPYGPLFEGGLADAETNDLIASLFGVLEWRAVVQSADGKVVDCTTKECLKNAKVKASYRPPLIKTIPDLINGKSGNDGLELYHCYWLFDSKVGAFRCDGGITTVKKSLTQGLRQKVKNKIDKIVDGIIGGGFMADPDEARWIKTVPIPNFPEILNYLAVIKKQGYNSQYDAAAQGVSELIASIMLKALVDNAYASLSSIGEYFDNKETPEAVAKAQETFNNVKTQVDKYINEHIQSNYITIQVASQTYRSIKAAAERAFVDKFGQSAYLFMR